LIPTYLCGDIGGTKTRLALFPALGQGPWPRLPGRPAALVERTYPSQGYACFEDLLEAFLAETAARPAAVCLGVAGPVHGRVCQVTNLPWRLDADLIQAQCGAGRAHLLNDLEATAWGLGALDPGDLCTLQVGRPNPQGNQCIIAAGTGLGEAGIPFLDGMRRPFASEGGHADLAAHDELGCDLVHHLRARYGFASWELAVSGPGLVEIYRFLHARRPGADLQGEGSVLDVGDPEAPADGAAAIAQAAAPFLDPATRTEADPLAVDALRLFVRLYGAEAGNLALKHLATGGVFVGGGIAPKLLPWLRRPEFLDAFHDKGRMRLLMEGLPVYVVLNDRAALLGPALYLAGT
jgi:glucokinase